MQPRGGDHLHPQIEFPFQIGDLETPVAAFAKLVGDEPGFLLESVEHGERWSRFSFVGRNPSATLLLRDGVAVFIAAGGIPTLFDRESVSQIIGEPRPQAPA